MITKKELQEFARLKGLTLGNAEKDYLIDIALLSISQNTKNELVFKGGTCLYKFYKLDRFSEDLDFSAIGNVDINKLINNVIQDFSRFGIKANQHQKREPFNSILITLRIEGPLFSGKSQTYANIGIDINLKSAVLLDPEALSYSSIYPEVPKVHAICMNPQEIFAEKIRALMTRKRARDLFDLNFLLQNNIYADKSLIEKKMEYYNEQFKFNVLFKKLSELSQNWKKELLGFTNLLPDFSVVIKNVKDALTKHYNDDKP